MQLLPLILLFLFSILTQLPSLLSSTPPPDPSFVFDPYPAGSGKYTLLRKSQNFKIDYYLDESNFPTTQIYADLLKSNSKIDLEALIAKQGSISSTLTPAFQLLPSLSSSTSFDQLRLPKSLFEFENRLEQLYLRNLQIQCENQQDARARKRQNALGFFGIGRDEELLNRLKAEPLPACARLRELNVRGY